MDELKGLVFDIQGFSVHDGPGSRTLVFLSGCPLRCEWCANPEGSELKQRLLFSTQRCKSKKNGCARCVNACPYGAITAADHEEKTIDFNRKLCNVCTTFECAKACCYEAARISGKWTTISELIRIIERDRNFWKKGGVTFTGGEPFVQKEFLKEVLKRCKKLYIHTAVETTAYVENDVFLPIMEYVDFAFIDIKHMDDEKHKEKTGVSNNLILQNITSLNASGWKGRLILRMPIINQYNDTEENIKSAIGFMIKNNLFEINILPFHRMGDSKWTQLGMTYKYKEELPTQAEKLIGIQNKFLNSKIACYVGEDVLY